MGDLVAAKDPINCFVADLQPGGGFQQVRMFLQRGIVMRIELRKKLLLMVGRHRAVTARRPGNNVQSLLVMPFQIAFDRVDMH